jgi:Fe-S-cluster containining protein
VQIASRRPPPGPCEQGLDRLWDRHRHGWRRLLSKQLAIEIQLRAAFDTELIAPWEVASQVPPATIPDCEACTDTCCAGIENLVSLRLVDVASLIDLDRTDLIAKEKPRFPESMLKDRPHLAELMESLLWRTLPVLRQVGESRVCAALGADRKCTIHPRWPTSCERFPYSLAAARRQVSWGSRCRWEKKGEALEARSRELADAAVAAYNERVRDAVLLHHARPELDALGIGAFLVKLTDSPFEPKGRLPIVE